MLFPQNDPYFDEGMRGHIYNMACANLWRVAGFELEDLISEGVMIFYKCRNRYVGNRKRGRRPDGTLRRYLPLNDPDPVAIRHFMRIVKRSFKNHLSTLATKCPRPRERLIGDMLRVDQPDERLYDAMLPEAHEESTVSILLQTAPQEIKQLFKLLLDDAFDLAGYHKRRLGRSKFKVRETTNEYFCRRLGLPTFDIVGKVEEHFLSMA